LSWRGEVFRRHLRHPRPRTRLPPRVARFPDVVGCGSDAPSRHHRSIVGRVSDRVVAPGRHVRRPRAAR
jgi:hypothetical protein